MVRRPSVISRCGWNGKEYFYFRSFLNSFLYWILSLVCGCNGGMHHMTI